MYRSKNAAMADTAFVKRWIILGCVFLSLGSLLWWVTGKYEERLILETNRDAAAELASNASSLTLSINRRLMLTGGLKGFIDAELTTESHIDRKHFDAFASYFIKNIQGVRNLSVNPDGIARYVYPIKNNEKLLGLNVFNHPNPEIRMNAERTKKTHEVTIVGPFELIQGGLGIVSRQSVFVKGRFWGFTSVALDLPPILEEAGLLHGQKGIDIAVRANGNVFMGDPHLFKESSLIAKIQLPEGFWEMAAIPKKEEFASVRTDVWTIRGSCLFALLLLIYFLYAQTAQRARLQVMVQERTENLLSANQQLEGKEHALRYMAYHDSVTGLNNRLFFHEHLNELLEQTKQTGHSIAVLFLDLDHFKLINDTNGHSFGDLLLQQVGDRLSATLPNNEVISRIGGDEFTIILPDITAYHQIEELTNRVINMFQIPFYLKDTEHYITSSIGIAVFPEHGADSQALLKNADTAMYRAKEEGKNNYRFYDCTMNPDADEKLEIKNSLRRALSRGEFEVYYQPQIGINTGLIVGLEALIRWNHPKLGMVPPSKFIPIAEDTGLIVPIGEWVLRTVCVQSQAWQSSGIPPVKIAVNLSARQLQQINLVGQIKQIIEESGLNPGYLELEITENMAMQDANLAKLSELRDMGITISIDDFGTHYSSLSYLKRLPVNKIKIDRSFVIGISEDPKDEAIIIAMLLVARNLNLTVIAEGVETLAQYSFLRTNQCDDIQGFLFYKPHPAGHIEQILHNHSRTCIENR
ncbi:EAL domain-containing protein [Paenibacillus sp. sptzw28]|uniref:bifunctional diguanylate cyclase/phosphodiesterase n=1 Tax=Paenibacillus sp. sptzw28 TaxID=715179 RepID=UPI001C6EE1BB|nr:EAL domain-containing protein [Paenibacillus sp. sptzw28]QYR20896.1 EAL domain-containing protein [Paenibacillus sp. sptzw28]